MTTVSSKSRNKICLAIKGSKFINFKVFTSTSYKIIYRQPFLSFVRNVRMAESGI
jgi:hypothetical protein